MNHGICDRCKKYVDHRIVYTHQPNRIDEDVCEDCNEKTGWNMEAPQQVKRLALLQRLEHADRKEHAPDPESRCEACRILAKLDQLDLEVKKMREEKS